MISKYFPFFSWFVLSYVFIDCIIYFFHENIFIFFLFLIQYKVVEKGLFIQEKEKLDQELNGILARQPGPEVPHTPSSHTTKIINY